MHYIHAEFYDYISSTAFSEHEIGLISDRLLKDIFYSTDTSIKTLIDEERKVSNILFPPEAANPRREYLLDILRASNALNRLPLTDSQLQNLKSWVDANIKDLDISSNIEWWSGKGPIFSHLIRITVALHSLSCFKVDINALESSFDSIISKKDLFHPIVIEFKNRLEVSKRFYFK